MKIIDERPVTQKKLTDIPYGTVFIDYDDSPKMKVFVNGHDYIIKLKSGDAYRVITDAMVTTVNAVLTIK